MLCSLYLFPESAAATQVELQPHQSASMTTNRLGLPTLWERHIEIRIPHFLWKLIWLIIFCVAKKSLEVFSQF